METPVHSPRPSDGVFFNGCYTPATAARRIHTTKNTKVRDDFEAELSCKRGRLGGPSTKNGLLDGIGQSLGNKTSVLPFNSRIVMDQDGMENSGSGRLTLEGCMPPDTFDCTVDDFLNEEMGFCSTLEERNEQRWNARSHFIDDDLFDERKSGVPWKNQSFHLDSDSDNFLRAQKCEISDYGLEDLCLLGERDSGKAWYKLDISESSCQYFKELASEKDCNFINLQEERHPVVLESGDFGSIYNQTAWSLLATKDTGDDVSLLSEESCSSSSVRGKQARKSESNFMKKLNLSKNSYGNELWKSLGDNMKNFFSEEMLHANLQGFHQENNLKGTEYRMRTPNLSRPRNSHCMKEFYQVQRISKPKQRLLFEEQCTSISMDSDLSPLNRTCRDMDATSPKYKFLSETPSDSFLVPKLHTETGLPCKRSKPVEPVGHTPYARLFSENDAEQLLDPVAFDSDIFSSIRSKLGMANKQPAPEADPKSPYSSSVFDLQKDNEIPDLSRQHSVKDWDELRSRSADCRQDLKGPQDEVSVEDIDLQVGNHKPLDVADFKNSCSECEEVKDRTPDPVESPKTRNSPAPADEPLSATQENPGKLESCISDQKCKTDAGKTVQYKNVDKDTQAESSVSERINIGNDGLCADNQSYRVMLESYVLQLLCMQKVLKEASELDAVKKERKRAGTWWISRQFKIKKRTSLKHWHRQGLHVEILPTWNGNSLFSFFP